MLLNWGLTPPCPPDSAGDSKVGTLCCKADRSLVNKTGHLDLLATPSVLIRWFVQTTVYGTLRQAALPGYRFDGLHAIEAVSHAGFHRLFERRLIILHPFRLADQERDFTFDRIPGRENGSDFRSRAAQKFFVYLSQLAGHHDGPGTEDLLHRQQC